MNIDKIEKHQ